MHIVVLDRPFGTDAQVDEIVLFFDENLVDAGKDLIQLMWILTRCGVEDAVVIDGAYGRLMGFVGSMWPNRNDEVTATPCFWNSEMVLPTPCLETRDRAAYTERDSPSASPARAKLPPSTIAARTPTFAITRPSNAISLSVELASPMI